jgi:hypothetical protein
MAKPRMRMINSSRFQKQATVLITKAIRDAASDTSVNVRKVVRDALEEKYRANLIASYGPRTKRGANAAEHYKIKKSTYTNTHTLEAASHAIIEEPYVKIVIDDSITYEDDNREVNAWQVYEWLTKGTNPDKNSMYVAINKRTQKEELYRNVPTPKHPIEELTTVDMRGFLLSLKSDIANGKYTKYKYTGKKTPRKYYRGEQVFDKRRE